MRKVDITETYSSREKAQIFWEIYQNSASEKSSMDFLSEAFGEGATLSLEELQEKYLDDESSSTIYKELKKIQEEHVANGDKKLALNQYWEEMIERNPYMEDNEAYDKNILFEQTAKNLGLWKEQTYEEKLIEYDYTKPVTANSRVARNNLIFELMRHRLMDKETLRDRLTPGGFDNSRNSARQMRHLLYNEAIKVVNDKVDLSQLSELAEQSDFDKAYDAADPNTLLFYNQLNQVAAKLIGIFANQNTNHQLSSVVRKLDLVKPIVFDGMIGAKIRRSAENLAGLSEAQMGKKTGSTLLAKEIELSDGRVVDVDLNLAEFLAASVDAVKDPVLNYLNFNTTTASTGALLARMGYSTRDIGILFNQPIIKELCEVIRNSGGTLQFNRAKSQVLKKFSGMSTFPKEVNTAVSSEDLAAQIVKYRELESDLEGQANLIRSDKNFRDMQVSALKIFEEAYNASRELSQYIATTKYTAANAVGSSMGFFYNQRYTVENYINQEESMLDMVIYELIAPGKAVNKSLDISEKDMSDRDAYMRSQWQNPYAFEQCMYDLNRELLRILEKYYPYNKALYSERRDAVSRFLPKGNVLDADTIDNIHRETSQHLLTSTSSAFNPSAICEEDRSCNNRDYYLYKFPLELFNAKEYAGPNYLPAIIAKYINFSYSDYKNKETRTVTKQLHISVNLNVEQADKNTFTDAWAALARGDEYQRKIAKGLFLHNYYKLGFNVGPFSFMQFTPLEVKQLLEVDGIPYLDYIDIDNLNNLNAASGTGSPRYATEFAYQYALNHTDNFQLVHRMSADLFSKDDAVNRERFKALFKKGLTVADNITLDLTETQNSEVNSVFVKTVDDSGEYPVFEVYPIIMYDGKVYAAQVNGDYNNVTDGFVNYKRVQVLGKKGIYNTYAPTLNEALQLAESSASALKGIEDAMEDSLKEALSQNEKDKVSSADQQAAQESLTNQASLSIETLDNLPVVREDGQDYADITSLLPDDIQQSLAQRSTDRAERNAKIEAAIKSAEALGIENAIEIYGLDGSIKLYLDEAGFQKLIDKIENSGNEDTVSTEGTTFSDAGSIDVDYNAIRDKMMSCAKVNETLIVNTMLDLLEEQGKVDYNKVDRESIGKNIISELNSATSEAVRERQAAGESISLLASKVIRKEIMVNELIRGLEESIKSGKKKVYTRLTKEQIC